MNNIKKSNFINFLRDKRLCFSCCNQVTFHRIFVKVLMTVSGVLVLMTLGLLTSTFAYIPKATLAAVIMSAVLTLVEYEVVPLLWHAKSTCFCINCINNQNGHDAAKTDSFQTIYFKTEITGVNFCQTYFLNVRLYNTHFIFHL